VNIATRLVVFESGFKNIFAGLGLELETIGLGLNLLLDLIQVLLLPDMDH